MPETDEEQMSRVVSFRSWADKHLDRMQIEDGGDYHYRFSCDKCGSDYILQTEDDGLRAVAEHVCR